MIKPCQVLVSFLEVFIQLLFSNKFLSSNWTYIIFRYFSFCKSRIYCSGIALALDFEHIFLLELDLSMLYSWSKHSYTQFCLWNSLTLCSRSPSSSRNNGQNDRQKILCQCDPWFGKVEGDCAVSHRKVGRWGTCECTSSQLPVWKSPAGHELDCLETCVDQSLILS